MNFWYYAPRWLERLVYKKVYRIELREMCVAPPILIKRKDGSYFFELPTSKLVPVRIYPGKYWWEFWKRLK